MASIHETCTRSEAQELSHNTQIEAFYVGEGHRKNVPSSLSTCSGSVTSGTHASTDDEADSCSALEKAQASKRASAWLDCGRAEEGMLHKVSDDQQASEPSATGPTEEWNKASACAWLDAGAGDAAAHESNRVAAAGFNQCNEACPTQITETGATASTRHVKPSNTEAWLDSAVGGQPEASAAATQRRGIRNVKLAPAGRTATDTLGTREGGDMHAGVFVASKAPAAEARHGYASAALAWEQCDGGEQHTQAGSEAPAAAAQRRGIRNAKLAPAPAAEAHHGCAQAGKQYNQAGSEAPERKRGDPYIEIQPKRVTPVAPRWSKESKARALPAAPRALPPPPPGAPPRPPAVQAPQTEWQPGRDQALIVPAVPQGPPAVPQGQWQAAQDPIARELQQHQHASQQQSWQQDIQHGCRQGDSQGQTRARLRSAASTFKPALSPTAPAFVPKAVGTSPFGIPLDAAHNSNVAVPFVPKGTLHFEDPEQAIRRVINQAFEDRLMFVTFTKADTHVSVEIAVRRAANQSPSPYEQADSLEVLHEAAQIGLGQRLHSGGLSDDGGSLQLEYCDCPRATWTSEEMCWEFLNGGFCPRGQQCHWLHAKMEVFHLVVKVQHGLLVQKKMMLQQQMQQLSAPMTPMLSLRPLLTALPPLALEPASPQQDNWDPAADLKDEARMPNVRADFEGTPRSDDYMEKHAELKQSLPDTAQESHVSTPRWEDSFRQEQAPGQLGLDVLARLSQSLNVDSEIARGLELTDLDRGGEPCISPVAAAKNPVVAKKASWADLEDDDGLDQWS